MKTRICRKCKIEKKITDFRKNKLCKNGYEWTCKLCHKKICQEYKQRNKEKRNILERKKWANGENVRYKEREKKRRINNPFRERARILRDGMSARARIKKIKFEKHFFTTDYLEIRLKNSPFCECCGKKLDIDFKKDKKFNDNSPSIDRIDPKIGYIKSNVAILCWRCNKHKQDATSKELRIIADYIDRFLGEQTCQDTE